MSFTKNEIIQQTAGLVATELGDGWTVDTTWPNGHSARLTGPDGAAIIVRAPQRVYGTAAENVERVELSSHYPDGWTKLPGNVEQYSITVKRDRGPDVIAREVTKRLLPDYLPELAEVQSRIAREKQAASSLADTIAELEKLAPGGYAMHDNRVRISIPNRSTYGDIRLNHDGSSVSELELRGLPLEFVRTVLAMLRDLPAES